MVTDVQKIPDRFYHSPTHAKGINVEKSPTLAKKLCRKNGLKKFEPFMMGLENNRIYSLKTFPHIKNRNGTTSRGLIKEISYDSSSSLTDEDFHIPKQKDQIDTARNCRKPLINDISHIQNYITNFYHPMSCEFIMDLNIDVHPILEHIHDRNKLSDKRKITSSINVYIGIKGFSRVNYNLEHRFDNNKYGSPLCLNHKTICKNCSCHAFNQISSLQLHFNQGGNVCQFMVSHCNLFAKSDKKKIKKYEVGKKSELMKIEDQIGVLYEACFVEYLTVSRWELPKAMDETDLGSRYKRLNKMYKLNNALLQLTLVQEKLNGILRNTHPNPLCDSTLNDLARLITSINLACVSKKNRTQRMSNFNACDLILLSIPFVIQRLDSINFLLIKTTGINDGPNLKTLNLGKFDELEAIPLSSLYHSTPSHWPLYKSDYLINLPL